MKVKKQSTRLPIGKPGQDIKMYNEGRNEMKKSFWKMIIFGSIAIALFFAGYVFALYFGGYVHQSNEPDNITIVYQVSLSNVVNTYNEFAENPQMLTDQSWQYKMNHYINDLTGCAVAYYSLEKSPVNYIEIAGKTFMLRAYYKFAVENDDISAMIKFGNEITEIQELFR